MPGGRQGSNVHTHEALRCTDSLLRGRCCKRCRLPNAVKNLVYDQKKYTMEQLMTALEANWQGYEDMRQDFLKAPK
ncbi:MAG: hypothetical protein II485_03370, partial [Firmicutes bacterium]|nr:hypothetical protein [Bacillota bacterium]